MLRADPHQVVTDVTELDLQRSCSPDRAGGDGEGLRGLPQQPSREPKARLEGWRRARHPGGDDHSADRRQHLLVQIPADLSRAARSGRAEVHHHPAPPGGHDPRHEPRAGDRQRVPRLVVDEDLALSLAADLQEHLQRPEGRHHPHRAQEAHDLLFRHQGFHRDDRTAAAGADHAPAQRVFHRDVGDRARATAARSTSSSATRC